VDSIADQLAQWAYELAPTVDDLQVADRALVDTVAVALAAREQPVSRLAAAAGDVMSEAARWAVAAHVLDFDDLHVPSTTHISVVCVPAALGIGGGPQSYLAAAGVMARLGKALGWNHYAAGWHATCTAGAPAVAAGAAVALGLGPEAIARALALAVPGAGGVQRAFGTDEKSLQIAFALDAGLRAARLAAAGAQADPMVLDEWLMLVGGDPTGLDMSGPAVPGGLAIKMYPACYALQRPIAAVAALARGPQGGVDAAAVEGIELRTPRSTVAPLIHHRPATGLQAKFSLEYAVATALLDDYQGFESFTDRAVRRDEAIRLVNLVETTLDAGGDGLLDGEVQVTLRLRSGEARVARMRFPPGSPERPPSAGELRAKVADCLRLAGLTGTDCDTWNWDNAARILREGLTAS
jgi:2-methylcitrate dehydratase PrpD